MPSTVTDLRAALAALSLDSRGNKDTLKKRLLRANKSSRQSSPFPPLSSSSQAGELPRRRRRPHDQQFDSFLVFDVEATCEKIDEPWGKFAFACVAPIPSPHVPTFVCNDPEPPLDSYPNEIIEWPVVLLQWQRRTVASTGDQDDDDNNESEEEEEEGWHLVQVDEFHSFVKPTWANRLSSFCTELTGITQASGKISSSGKKGAAELNPSSESECRQISKVHPPFPPSATNSTANLYNDTDSLPLKIALSG